MTAVVPAPAPLTIGPFEVWPPVVLAPMAGVTNAPFRALCREYGPDPVGGAVPGLYVNEMVMALALVHRNAKTERMIRFAPHEQPRSLQLYGSDPDAIGRAVQRVVGDGLGQVGGGGHFRLVDGHDDVARANASALGGATFFHLADE